METNDNEYLAYLKYEGKSVQSGYLDARKSAQALIGFDEALRYFVYQEDPEFQTVDFEIPVRIRKGSWEALIPQNIGEWITTGVGIAATTYASSFKKVVRNFEKIFSET